MSDLPTNGSGEFRVHHGKAYEYRRTKVKVDQDATEQLGQLRRREKCKRFKNRNKGLQTVEDYTAMVLWVMNNLWRDLKPLDMPYPHYWTLYTVAKANEKEFVKDYFKPLMVNQLAQKTLQQHAEKKAGDVEEVSGGESKLEGIL